MAVPLPPPRLSPTADLFSKKFKDQLNCSVCLERFVQPKILPCQHVFCLKCVEIMGKDGDHVSCPLCRSLFELPKGCASQLPSAFQIIALMEFQEELEKNHKFNRRTDSTSVCGKHAGNPLDVYCCTCKLLICCKCVVSGDHKTHCYEIVSDAYPTILKGLLDQINALNAKMEGVQLKIQMLNSRKMEIQQQGQLTKDSIQLHAQQLIDKIQSSENMLTSQVNDVVFKKTWVLDGQIEAAKHVYTELENCVESIQRNLIEWNSSAIVMGTSEMCIKMQEANNSSPPPSVFTPLETATLAFISSVQDGNIGKVEGVSSTCKCFDESVLNLSLCVPQQISTATLTLKSNKNYIPPPSLIHCSLSYPKADKRTQLARFKEQLTDGSYLFTFTLPDTQNVQLTITVGGIELSGSPFKVPIISKAMVAQKASKIISGLKKPWGVSISFDGKIVVAESEANCVSVICGTSGLKTASFGAGELEEPRGLAISHDQHILVADGFHVRKFTFDGVCVKSVSEWSNNGLHKFKDPDGVAVTSTGSVLVSDHGSHAIHVFTANLAYSHSIDLSKDNLCFDGPCGVAVDSSDNIFIAESGNRCITKLTSTGKYITRFGQQHLFWPTGVVVSNDLVYVCEERFHKVVIFNGHRGKMLYSFGTRGVYDGNFISPFGIGIDETENLLYVCDSLNDRICCY